MFVWQFWLGMIVGILFIMGWMLKDEIRFQIKIDKKMGKGTLKNLSEKSGISPMACYRLVEAGWKYEERLNEPSRWVNPMASLQNLST
jgi:hypothetical protein